MWSTECNFSRIYLIGRTHIETLHRKYARQRRTEQAYDWVEINSAKECDCCWCVSVCVCVLHVLRTYPIWYAVGPVLASGYHSKSPINFTIIRIRGTVQNYFCTRPESNLFLSHHQHIYFSFLEFVAWIRKKIVFNLLWVYNFKIQSKSVYNFWTIHNQKVDLFDRKEIFLFCLIGKRCFRTYGEFGVSIKDRCFWPILFPISNVNFSSMCFELFLC